MAQNYDCLDLLDDPTQAIVTIEVKTPTNGTLKFIKKLQNLQEIAKGSRVYVSAVSSDGKQYSTSFQLYSNTRYLKNREKVTFYRIDLESMIYQGNENWKSEL